MTTCEHITSERRGGWPPSVSEEPVEAVHILEPPKRWQFVDVKELWRFRELIGFLAWRDVKVRYKQTLLGAAWAVLQPALMMVVFTIFFGRMAKVPSGGIPYPLFAYAGLLPWTFFATAVANACNSVVSSEQLITKIYFPRLAIPFAAVGAALVDFVVAFGLLLVMMTYYGIAPGVGFLLAPIIVILVTLAALGAGCLLAALNVSYRDFRYVVPFLIQLWMFATPTIYMQVSPEVPAASSPGVSARQAGAVQRGAAGAEPSSIRDADGRGSLGRGGLISTVLAVNPMTTLIGSFRSATLGGRVSWPALGLSAGGVVAALLAGCLYFRKLEDQFADVI